MMVGGGNNNVGGNNTASNRGINAGSIVGSVAPLGSLNPVQQQPSNLRSNEGGNQIANISN